MIRYFLILFLLLVSFSAQAQGKKDSLKSVQHYTAASELFEMGNSAEALKELDRAIALYPHSAQYFYSRSNIHAFSENYSQAVEDLKMADKLMPGMAVIQGNIGWYLILQKKFTEALPWCAAAYQIDSTAFNYALNLGHSYLLSGNYPQAIPYYNVALQNLPDKHGFYSGCIADLDMFIEKGWSVVDAKAEKERMLTEFNRTYQYWEESDSLWNVSKSLQAEGKYAEAIKVLMQCIAADQQAAVVRKKDLEIEYCEVAYCYRKLLKFTDALQFYYPALAVSKELNDEVNAEKNYSNIAYCHYRLNDMDSAKFYYQLSEKILRRQNNKEELLPTLKWLATVNGKTASAQNYYTEALAIAMEIKDSNEVHNIAYDYGEVLRDIGDFEKAREYYEMCLSYAANARELAFGHNNMGYYLSAIHQPEEAMRHLLKAVDIATHQVKDTVLIVKYRRSVCQAYNKSGQHLSAWGYRLFTINILRQSGDVNQLFYELHDLGAEDSKSSKENERTAAILESVSLWPQVEKNSPGDYYVMGKNYMLLNNYDSSRIFIQQGLDLAGQLNFEIDLMTGYFHLITLAKKEDNKHEALTYLEKVIIHDRKLGWKTSLADDLASAAGYYYIFGDYKKAVAYLEESIELNEGFIKSTTGKERMNFIAGQIAAYRRLVAAYTQVGQFEKALQAAENSRARSLAEKLTNKQGSLTRISADKIVKSLGPTEAVFYLTKNMYKRENSVLIITSEGITGVVLSDSVFAEHFNKLDPVLAKYIRKVAKQKTDELEAKMYEAETDEEKLKYYNAASKIIAEYEQKAVDAPELVMDFYRYMLKGPGGDRGISVEDDKGDFGDEETLTADIANMFYRWLFLPVEAHLNGKSKITVLTDGGWGFIPFETFRNNQGKYLAQVADFNYTYSVGVQQLIAQRKYSPGRKPLLSFGGAVYDEELYAMQMNFTQYQMQEVQQQMQNGVASRSAKQYYEALGIGSWGNLPGTLSEVMAIQSIVKDAQTITGAEVNEENLKRMSADGTLAKYKVLHFATHGLVVPEVPELSAVVLSQSKKEEKEDGYLRMEEIAELNLQADFVNLSACETGLGKIYGGEGIVGLTQSFLIAGANSLSVSLWQVADESTSKFMVAVYELVAEKNFTYAQAIAEVKRRFIAGEFGEEYKKPYYWAPFVFYGS